MEARERQEAEVERREQEEQARKQIAHQKLAVVFMLDFASQPVHSVADDEELKAKKCGGNLDWSAPLVVKKSQLLSQLTSASNKITATIDRWCKAFPSSKVYKEHDTVSTCLVEQQGISELTPLLDMFFKSEEMVTSPLPSFKEATLPFKLFGEASTYANFDFEVMFLGFLPGQLRGVSKFVLVSPASWLQALEKNGTATKSLQLGEICDAMKGLSQNNLKTLTDNGCKIHHVELSPGQCLFVPGGWFIAQTSFGDAAVVALKQVLLPKFGHALKETTANLEALLALGMKTATRQSLRSVQDVLAVAKPIK